MIFPKLYRKDEPLNAWGLYVDVQPDVKNKDIWNPHMSVFYLKKSESESNAIDSSFYIDDWLECEKCIADTRSENPSEWFLVIAQSTSSMDDSTGAASGTGASAATTSSTGASSSSRDRPT